MGGEVSPRGPAHTPTARGGGSPSQTHRQLGQWWQGRAGLPPPPGRARSGRASSAQRFCLRLGPQGHRLCQFPRPPPLPAPPPGSSPSGLPPTHVAGTKRAGHEALPEPRGNPTLLTPHPWRKEDTGDAGVREDGAAGFCPGSARESPRLSGGSDGQTRGPQAPLPAVSGSGPWHSWGRRQGSGPGHGAHLSPGWARLPGQRLPSGLGDRAKAVAAAPRSGRGQGGRQGSP